MEQDNKEKNSASNSRNGKNWTEKEDNYLKKNYLDKTRVQLAQELNRTPAGVERRLLKVLKLKKSMNLVIKQQNQLEIIKNKKARDELKDVVPDEWLELPFTKAQAKELNSNHFFTGFPCTKGHLSLRRTYGGCITCYNESQAERRQRPEVKEATRKRDQKRWADPIQREKMRQTRRVYGQSESGKKVLKKSQEKYLDNNREKIYKRNSEVHKQRMKTDDAYRLLYNLRRRMLLIIQKNRTTKAETSKALVGCTIEDLMNHLESLFENNMSWENMGKEGWHIDHIRPCSSFDIANPEQQKVCFNWRNLQPMKPEDNYAKHDNYTPVDEAEWVERMISLGYEGELFLKYEEGNSY